MPVFSAPSRFDQVIHAGFRCPVIPIDVRSYLQDARAQDIYYHWGTHWNSRASIMVWPQVKSALAAHRVSVGWPTVESHFAARNARPLEDSMWEWLGHQDPEVISLPYLADFHTTASGLENEPGRPSLRMLAVGDSFLQFSSGFAPTVTGSNTVTGPNMPLPTDAELADSNSWLVFLRPDLHVDELMSRYHPNVLVIEVVERYVEQWTNLRMPPN